ncbi:hypothetical protein [Amycolatopsis sp. NBC_01286]|uniref:hypothetical protein n=1 Tax=Amycolatopsis sp. NBC_01286 TaxID=2903560 RepID=UPI002E16674F|nr:hypothetical protein OG570_20975 [Amycolatopsis sp. NBC_01286]
MIKRVLAGLLAAAAIGTLAVPAAAAAPGTGTPGGRPPGTGCVWMWTQGPPECRKLE